MEGRVAVGTCAAIGGQPKSDLFLPDVDLYSVDLEQRGFVMTIRAIEAPVQTEPEMLIEDITDRVSDALPPEVMLSLAVVALRIDPELVAWRDRLGRNLGGPMSDRAEQLLMTGLYKGDLQEQAKKCVNRQQPKPCYASTSTRARNCCWCAGTRQETPCWATPRGRHSR